jgi:hypothetical protein
MGMIGSERLWSLRAAILDAWRNVGVGNANAGIRMGWPMNVKVKRPARARSQTRSTGRRSKPHGSYATIPLQRTARLVLPKLGMERSASLFASALLTVVLLALLVLPHYAVETIEIGGNMGTPTEDIEAAVEFAQGHNAFLLRTSDVVAAVMALPGVEKVTARVLLPGTLRLDLKDARPEVLWLAGSQALWVDSLGIVRDQPPVEPERKLTIKDISGRSYQRGDQIDKSALAAAQQLGILMPRDIQGLEFQREGELYVVSVQGWRALFNTRGDLEKQVNAVRRAVASITGITYIDVRVPEVISYIR